MPQLTRLLVTVAWTERHIEQVATGAECVLAAAIAAVDSMRDSGRGGTQEPPGATPSTRGKRPRPNSFSAPDQPGHIPPA